MRIIPTALLAGAGSLVIAGSAAAESLPAHTMTIQLPDGSIEEIHYTGDTAPQIDVVPAISAIAAPSPFWAFGPNSPFAAMEQISAAMDRGDRRAVAGDPNARGDAIPRIRRIDPGQQAQSAARRPELQLRRHPVARRRLHPQRGDHLHCSRCEAANRVAQLRQLRRGGECRDPGRFAGVAAWRRDSFGQVRWRAGSHRSGAASELAKLLTR